MISDQPAEKPSVADDGVVEVHTSIDSAQLAVLRNVAATLTMDAGFTVDSVEDARLLVDEVCSTLIRNAERGAQLSCRFRADDRFYLHAQATASPDAVVDRSSWSWRIMSTLADTLISWTNANPGQPTTLHIEATKASDGCP
ncbi:hypothetical protein [Sciscionella marina]|uniref:hypothetical protein n=1 Tax=Sciscionella marina TaxID=508770 RepID=UPI00035D300F|nr:hypothetical protein [Sciscionella marina]